MFLVYLTFRIYALLSLLGQAGFVTGDRLVIHQLFSPDFQALMDVYACMKARLMSSSKSNMLLPADAYAL